MELQPKPGETLDQWLARAVPKLVQDQGMSEEQATQTATDQFHQAQQPSPDPQQPPAGDQPMNWDQSTWGQSATDPNAADPNTTSPDPTATPQPDAGGDTGQWFQQQLATLGNVLMERLLNEGAVQPDQRGAMQQVIDGLANGDAGSTAGLPGGVKIEIALEFGNTGDQASPDPTAQPETQPPPSPADQQLKTWIGANGIGGPVFLRQRYKGDGHDLSIKALSADRIGSYLCVWGAPFKADLVDEFFTPHTKGLTDIFDAVGKVPAIYHHALDRTLKSAVIGLVDTMQPDDVGMWVEAQITRRAEYEQMIKPLIDKAMLGWSSGALPGGREVNKATGEIVYWPIAEASMTPTPMEWRMSLQWPIGHIKTAYQIAGLNGDPLTELIKTGQANRHAKELAIEQERIRILGLLS